jgi:hypothetical protein
MAYEGETAMLQPLGPSELEWIRGRLYEVRQLAPIDGADDDDGLSPEDLDAGFEAWMRDWMMTPQRVRSSASPAVKAFSVAFGQILVDRLSLEWALVTDQNTTDLAVRGQPGDIVLFPARLVAKRFEARATGFFRPLYDSIREQVAQVRSAAPQA